MGRVVRTGSEPSSRSVGADGEAASPRGEVGWGGVERMPRGGCPLPLAHMPPSSTAGPRELGCPESANRETGLPGSCSVWGPLVGDSSDSNCV